MENECEVCGTPGRASNRVRSLMELGGADEAGHQEIRLCGRCVQKRQVRSWDRRGMRAHAIHEALDRMPARSGRYAYLEDARRVRLLRLRHGWISAHAAVTTS